MTIPAEAGIKRRHCGSAPPLLPDVNVHVRHVHDPPLISACAFAK